LLSHTIAQTKAHFFKEFFSICNLPWLNIMSTYSIPHLRCLAPYSIY